MHWQEKYGFLRSWWRPYADVNWRESIKNSYRLCVRFFSQSHSQYASYPSSKLVLLYTSAPSWLSWKEERILHFLLDFLFFYALVTTRSKWKFLPILLPLGSSLHKKYILDFTHIFSRFHQENRGCCKNMEKSKSAFFSQAEGVRL